MAPIVPRRMDFPFEGVPEHWFAGNATATHAVNALNLVFPDGERYFVRSVLHYLPTITDPELKARVRAFFAQEALHGREHERAYAFLEGQGYEVESWLAWYEKVAYGGLEKRFGPATHLAITAALEHLTASLAEEVLGGRDLLAHAHPVMGALLKWHAAEEIEHRDVAYDVLQQVDPRLRTRIFGMVVAVAVFLFFWGSARRHLQRQDRTLTRERAREDRRQLAKLGIGDVRPRIVGFTLDYLKRDFHPKGKPLDALASAYLASIGRLEA